MPLINENRIGRPGFTKKSNDVNVYGFSKSYAAFPGDGIVLFNIGDFGISENDLLTAKNRLIKLDLTYKVSTKINSASEFYVREIYTDGRVSLRKTVPIWGGGNCSVYSTAKAFVNLYAFFDGSEDFAMETVKIIGGPTSADCSINPAIIVTGNFKFNI